MSNAHKCEHKTLSFASSTHANDARFLRSSAQQRLAATTPQGTTKSCPQTEPTNISSSFPAPLVLPDDDLSIDPSYPPQSLRAWIRSKDRNHVTSARNVVYVVAPPSIHSGVENMQSWTHPAAGKGTGNTVEPPRMADVVEYIAAYYDGMPVKTLPSPGLSFVPWENSAPSRTSQSKSKKQHQFVGLNISTEVIRIRTRASNDKTFTRQLNLDDLLDGAISILPEDAYALIMLVNHDLFEDEDDEFVCGRAYGGSRVAVISTARYNPILDSVQDVERMHAWPASHCTSYMRNCCSAASESPPAPKKRKQNDSHPDETATTESSSPLHAAVSAHKALPPLDPSPSAAALTGLWLGRVCRTSSHELGHCFGIDHCVYYACGMQGSASLPEDARQPPYLCPIDEAKLLSATGSTAEKHYNALLRFCEKHAEVHLFAAFGAWIHARLGILKDLDS